MRVRCGGTETTVHIRVWVKKQERPCVAEGREVRNHRGPAWTMPGDYERTNKLAADRAQKEEEKKGTGMAGAPQGPKVDTERNDALRDVLRSAPPPRTVLGEAASASTAGDPVPLSGGDGEGPNKRGRIHEPGFPHNLQRIRQAGSCQRTLTNGTTIHTAAAWPE